MANSSRCSTTLTLEPLTKSLREFGRPSVPSRSNSATAAQLGPIVPESLRRPDPIASETLSAGRNHGSGSPRRRKGRGTQPTPSCWPAPRFSCDRDGRLRRASDARLTPAPRRVALTLRGAASLQPAPWSRASPGGVLLTWPSLICHTYYEVRRSHRPAPCPDNCGCTQSSVLHVSALQL